MKRIAISALAIIAAMLLWSCDSSTPSIQRIEVKVQLDDVKRLYLDNFLNISQNESLNFLEEGIPTQLSDALGALRSISLVPREKVKKYQAGSAGETGAEPSSMNLAKKFGAQYILDGTIARDYGFYRVSANLLDLESNIAQESFVAVRFRDPDEIDTKIIELVDEIRAKMSLPTDELAALSPQPQMKNYENYRRYIRAWQAYLRGNPEVAIVMMERVLKDISGYPAGSVEDFDTVMNLEFRLGQIANEIGDRDRARAYIGDVYKNRKEWLADNAALQDFIAALWAEVNGRYDEALATYAKLKDQDSALDREYYLRAAQIATRRGEEPRRALAILSEGTQRFPDEMMLRRYYIQLQLQLQGDSIVDQYAAEALDKGEDPLNSEFASMAYKEKLDMEAVRELPQRAPRLIKFADNADESIEFSFSSKDFKIDFSGEDVHIDSESVLEAITKLAEIASNTGNFELALQIADGIAEKGKGERASDYRNRILAAISLNRGNLEEAEHYALEIPVGSPNRYFTLGKVYLKTGRPLDAAKAMEKGLKLGGAADPMTYYNIANAYLLAGDYKRWNEYNRIFLKEGYRKKKPALKVIEQGSAAGGESEKVKK